MADVKRETVGVELSVRPVLDKSSTAKLMKEIQSLGKTSQQNVLQIKDMSKAAEQFAKKLGTAAQASFKSLEKLGDQLDDALAQAESLEDQYKQAKTGADKAKLAGDLGRTKAAIAGLNKAIEDHRKTNVRAQTELKNVLKVQKEYQDKIRSAADFSGKDAFKGVGAGLIKALSGGKDNFKSGLLDMVKSTAKGVQGGVARAGEEKMLATGGAEGAAMAESMGVAMGALAGAAVAVGALVKLIMAASDHMTNLNKALLKGNGLANEFGSSAKDYASSVKAIRDSAISASGPLLKMGMTSEDAMSAVGAYAREATGSIVKTKIELQAMGGGNLDAGLLAFSRNAQVYGKALGMEATEVAGLMGKLVGEVGHDSQNAQKIMGDVVKQAAQAGIPVHKFMDIFREAVPNLDLFTNRIEELTGVMKLLSKTMDARAVKGFMQAFGRGFDQLDFKQRLKMALVVGPGEMGKIMDKDIARAGRAVRENLPESLSHAFDEAMEGKDNVKKMAKVAARAAAMGISGDKIGAMNQAARQKELRGGGVLKMATGMRDMGMLGRMEALEKYAGRFTGGDITGLGEHVAKQLGVSEQEYKALVDLKASMGTHMASIADYGRTGSVSINNGLKKILKQDAKYADKDLENDDVLESVMKEMASGKDAKKLEGYIKEAATMQMDADAAEAAKAKDEMESMEDLATEQINVTQSMSDKINNIIQVLLEKIYYVINDVFGSLNDIYNMLPNWLTKDTSGMQKTLTDWSASAKKDLGAGHDVGARYYVEMNNSLKQMLKDGKNTSEILNSSQDIWKLTNKDKDGNVDEKNLREIFSQIKPDVEVPVDEYGTTIKQSFSQDLIDAIKSGDLTKQSELLRSLDPEQAVKAASMAAFRTAKTMADAPRGQIDLGPARVTHDEKIKRGMAEKERLKAKATGDLDERARLAAEKKDAELEAEYQKKRAEERARLQDLQSKGNKDAEKKLKDMQAEDDALAKKKAEAAAAQQKAQEDAAKTQAATARMTEESRLKKLAEQGDKSASDKLAIMKEEDKKAWEAAKAASEFVGPPLPPDLAKGAAPSADPSAAPQPPGKVHQLKEVIITGSDHIEAAQDTAAATQSLLDANELAEQKAERDYQNTADVLSLLKKGLRFEQSWMDNKYKKVLKEASLDAFRPALAEYLLAYMRVSTNDEVRNKYLADPDSNKLSLAQIGQVKTQEEMDQALAIAKAPHMAGGGLVPTTGAYMLSAGEGVLSQGSVQALQGGGGGNKTVNVGGIHISIGQGDPNAVKGAVLQALDEIHRRH